MYEEEEEVLCMRRKRRVYACRERRVYSKRTGG
jgi:hypothetical protein